IAADRARLQRAVDLSDVAVLAFEAGDPFRPLLLALFPQPTADDDAPVATKHEAVKVDVDGRRLLIEGKDEIVLQCGNASVTLRLNGKVVIRGTHVETASAGTNRIKGSQVRIN